jgi:WD40 repeat protein
MLRRCTLWALGAWVAILCQPWADGRAAETGTRAGPGQRGGRVDALGDPLPPGALLRIGTLRLRHQGRVTGVAMSPDGKRVASVGYDGTTRLWDVATGQEVRKFVSAQGGVPLAVAFSPDGKTLVVSIRETFRWFLRLWDVRSGEVVDDLKPGPHEGGQFALSADGRLLVCEMASLIHVWEIQRRVKVRKFKVQGRQFTTTPLALSPDGRLLAWGGDGVRVYSVDSGKEVWHARGPRNFQGHTDVSSLAFSPDGKTLAAPGRSKPVELYDARTGQAKGTIGTGCASLAFSPDGRQLALGLYRPAEIAIWDVAKGIKVRDIRSQIGGTSSLVFSKDGKTLASNADGLVRLWSLSTGKELHPPPAHLSAIQCLSYLRGGQTLASYGNDFTARLWDANTGKPLSQVQLPRPSDYDFGSPGFSYQYADLLAAAPDGKTLALCGIDQTLGVGLWNRASGKVLSLKGHKGFPCGVAFTPDGKTVIGGDDYGGIHFWDTATGTLQKKHFTVEVRREARGGERIYQNVSNLVCSPDGKTLAASASGLEIRLWDLTSGKETARWPTDRYWNPWLGVSLAFSPDSRLLASTASKTDNLILLWDVRAGKLRSQFKNTGSPINEVAFSPDGGLLAAGCEKDGTVQLWEVATGQQVYHFKGHEGGVNAVAFSPDGRRLASGSKDTTILVWDLLAPGRPRFKALAGELERLWAELASAQPARAYQAACALVLAGDQGVDLLSRHLRPIRGDRKLRSVEQLLADLNNDNFGLREAATQELKARGWEAYSDLEKALKASPSPETRRRLQQLLGGLHAGKLDPENLRQQRAIQILERIESEKARRVLETLAKGASSAAQTRDALAALGRLQTR